MKKLLIYVILLIGCYMIHPGLGVIFFGLVLSTLFLEKPK